MKVKIAKIGCLTVTTITYSYAIMSHYLQLDVVINKNKRHINYISFGIVRADINASIENCLGRHYTDQIKYFYRDRTIYKPNFYLNNKKIG